MFQWNVEDLILYNEKSHIFFRAGKEKIYNCESRVSREDKIAFVDSMQDGMLSYILSLIEKFEQDKENLPKDQYGNIKTVSLKAWIRRNDTKYEKPILDTYVYHGRYHLLDINRSILYNEKGIYETYDDLVDEAFHCQLKRCEEKERLYFLSHDEYSILKKELREKIDKYSTSFGVSIVQCSDGTISVGDFDVNREITIDELKELLSKFKQLDNLVEKITSETNIV